jgi:hypothetical protein
MTAVSVWLSAVILWWTGWRREMAEGVPQRIITLFLVSWPFAVRTSIALEWGGHELALNGALPLTIGCAAAGAIRLDGVKWGASVAAGMLIASIVLFLDKIVELLPGVSDANPIGIEAALLAVLTPLLLRTAPEQGVALTAGLVLAEAASVYWIVQSGWKATAGGWDWSARWWLAFMGARLVSAVALWIPSFAKNRLWRKGGERS